VAGHGESDATGGVGGLAESVGRGEQVKTMTCSSCAQHGRGRQVLRYVRDVPGGAAFICDTCGSNCGFDNAHLGRPADYGPRKPGRGVGYGGGTGGGGRGSTGQATSD
jgi:hypothetical protein